MNRIGNMFIFYVKNEHVAFFCIAICININGSAIAYLLGIVYKLKSLPCMWKGCVEYLFS
jgi:hypothetical protein